MALLHYENLQDYRPDVLMKNAFFGLRTFHRFLSQAKNYLSKDVAVRRLAWLPATHPEKEEFPETNGTWVELEAPKDRPNEPEATFKAFMDENVREVFESDHEGASTEHARHSFTQARKIRVIDRDPENCLLQLERLPKQKGLLLRPNDLTLKRQIWALEALQNAPSKAHMPLLRLMESVDHARWPNVECDWVQDWMVLTDPDRAGTKEQRKFVEIAISTPDFALLEGPPGSGKTTAICELILQLALQGKRVLLCASTHVAVDNVLERLMDKNNPDSSLLIPVRIGEGHNVSEKAQQWQLGRFVKTEQQRLRRELQKQKKRSASQEALLDRIRSNPSSIERMVLEAANLVCGTTIGILQHPDIKKKGATTPVYDVLIVDEASKTTFQEFMVPALLAKRWILVGDPKQLSPYVDEDAMAVNVTPCLEFPEQGEACVDVFMAGQPARKRRIAAVVTEDEKVCQAYQEQAAARGIELKQAESCANLWQGAIVLGKQADMEKRIGELPLDITTIRAPENSLEPVRRRSKAFLRNSKRPNEEQPNWTDEITWRMASLYEQRFSEQTKNSSSQRLRNEIEQLLPAYGNTEPVRNKIDQVRRVALPSIIESIKQGFEREKKTRKGTALTDGLPEPALKQRHVILSSQHRMHPEIAAFSHTHIYDEKALFTPEGKDKELDWGYPRHEHHAVWHDVQKGFDKKTNSNPEEAKVIIEELRAFEAWAKNNPRKKGGPWEAAVLTFYRGQERVVRQHLRKWSGNQHAVRRFVKGSKKQPYLTVELCTVDRFQGHEADLVLLSFASDHPTTFLESPNRLNVALTRARYQRIIVGNRKKFQRKEHSLLGKLANESAWDQKINHGADHAKLQ